jgi:hypothetical protein
MAEITSQSYSWEDIAITALAVLPTLAVPFVASLTHATFGFSTASMAMPLLVMTLGFQAATALVGLVMLTTSWRCRVFSWQWAWAGGWGAICLWRNSSVHYTGCLLP